MKPGVTGINIDATAIRKWVPVLARIHKSAFPIAIRKTLNEAALDVKQVSMPMESDKAFTKRKPTFWGATSRVEFAAGFDVSTMAAKVGFVAPPDVKESGHATRDLQQQEEGGAIDKRAFIAGKAARTSKGNVRDKLTMKSIKHHIVDAKKEQGKNDAEKFIRAAMKVGYGGNGVGGFVIGTIRSRNGSYALLRINSIHRARKGGGMVVNSTAIYSVKKHRKAKVKATHFMAEAAADTQAKMDVMFKKNVIVEVNKVRNK